MTIFEDLIQALDGICSDPIYLDGQKMLSIYVSNMTVERVIGERLAIIDRSKMNHVFPLMDIRGKIVNEVLSGKDLSSTINYIINEAMVPFYSMSNPELGNPNVFFEQFNFWYLNGLFGNLSEQITNKDLYQPFNVFMRQYFWPQQKELVAWVENHKSSILNECNRLKSILEEYIKNEHQWTKEQKTDFYNRFCKKMNFLVGIDTVLYHTSQESIFSNWWSGILGDIKKPGSVVSQLMEDVFLNIAQSKIFLQMESCFFVEYLADFFGFSRDKAEVARVTEFLETQPVFLQFLSSVFPHLSDYYTQPELLNIRLSAYQILLRQAATKNGIQANFFPIDLDDETKKILEVVAQTDFSHVIFPVIMRRLNDDHKTLCFDLVVTAPMVPNQQLGVLIGVVQQISEKTGCRTRVGFEFKSLNAQQTHQYLGDKGQYWLILPDIQGSSLQPSILQSFVTGDFSGDIGTCYVPHQLSPSMNFEKPLISLSNLAPYLMELDQLYRDYYPQQRHKNHIGHDINEIDFQNIVNHEWVDLLSEYGFRSYFIQKMFEEGKTHGLAESLLPFRDGYSADIDGQVDFGAIVQQEHGWQAANDSDDWKSDHGEHFSDIASPQNSPPLALDGENRDLVSIKAKLVENIWVYSQSKRDEKKGIYLQQMATQIFLTGLELWVIRYIDLSKHPRAKEEIKDYVFQQANEIDEMFLPGIAVHGQNKIWHHKIDQVWQNIADRYGPFKNPGSNSVAQPVVKPSIPYPTEDICKDHRLDVDTRRSLDMLKGLLNHYWRHYLPRPAKDNQPLAVKAYIQLVGTIELWAIENIDLNKHPNAVYEMLDTLSCDEGVDKARSSSPGSSARREFNERFVRKTYEKYGPFLTAGNSKGQSPMQSCARHAKDPEDIMRSIIQDFSNGQLKGVVLKQALLEWLRYSQLSERLVEPIFQTLMEEKHSENKDYRHNLEQRVYKVLQSELAKHANLEQNEMGQHPQYSQFWMDHARFNQHLWNALTVFNPNAQKFGFSPFVPRLDSDNHRTSRYVFDPSASVTPWVSPFDRSDFRKRDIVINPSDHEQEWVKKILKQSLDEWSFTQGGFDFEPPEKSDTIPVSPPEFVIPNRYDAGGHDSKQIEPSTHDQKQARPISHFGFLTPWLNRFLEFKLIRTLSSCLTVSQSLAVQNMEIQQHSSAVVHSMAAGAEGMTVAGSTTTSTQTTSAHTQNAGASSFRVITRGPHDTPYRSLKSLIGTRHHITLVESRIYNALSVVGITLFFLKILGGVHVLSKINHKHEPERVREIKNKMGLQVSMAFVGGIVSYVLPRISGIGMVLGLAILVGQLSHHIAEHALIRFSWKKWLDGHLKPSHPIPNIVHGAPDWRIIAQYTQEWFRLRTPLSWLKLCMVARPWLQMPKVMFRIELAPHVYIEKTPRTYDQRVWHYVKINPSAQPLAHYMRHKKIDDGEQSILKASAQQPVYVDHQGWIVGNHPLAAYRVLQLMPDMLLKRDSTVPPIRPKWLVVRYRDSDRPDDVFSARYVSRFGGLEKAYDFFLESPSIIHPLQTTRAENFCLIIDERQAMVFFVKGDPIRLSDVIHSWTLKDFYDDQVHSKPKIQPDPVSWTVTYRDHKVLDQKVVLHQNGQTLQKINRFFQEKLSLARNLDEILRLNRLYHTKRYSKGIELSRNFCDQQEWIGAAARR